MSEHTKASVMEQAQVFASAWSLVGGIFDSGDALDDAEEAKRELAEMVGSVVQQRDDLLAERDEIIRQLRLLLGGDTDGEEEPCDIIAVAALEMQKRAMQRDDLLSSLKHVMQWIDNWSPNFTDDRDWPADRSAALVAIASAEGREVTR